LSLSLKLILQRRLLGQSIGKSPKTQASVNFDQNIRQIERYPESRRRYRLEIEYFWEGLWRLYEKNLSINVKKASAGVSADAYFASIHLL